MPIYPMPAYNQGKPQQFGPQSTGGPMGGPMPGTPGFKLKYNDTNYHADADNYLQQELGRTGAITDIFKKQRNADMKEGAAAGEKMFGAGSLGRLDEKPNAQLTELMRGRMGGYTSPEFAAMRDTATRDSNRSFQGSKKQLAAAQANQGTGGAQGSAQMMQLLKNKNRGDVEANQNLMIKNIEAKKAGAADYAQALSGLQGVQTANMGRQEKELLDRFQTQMGYASLGAAERSAASQLGAATSQQAQANQQKTSGKF